MKTECKLIEPCSQNGPKNKNEPIDPSPSSRKPVFPRPGAGYCRRQLRSNEKTSKLRIEQIIKNWAHQGVQGGPTNQLFTPKIAPGTPWAPQTAPERSERVAWTMCCDI